MSEPIIVYAGGGSYDERDVDSFVSILQDIDQTRRSLYECSSDTIIRILDKFGKNIIQDPDLAMTPGLPYLSLWLRKENLTDLYQVNFRDLSELNQMIKISSRGEMFPAPRGIICHWIAGNIPVLGFFSLALATLGKNASILKISPELGRMMSLLLKKLEETAIFVEGEEITGACIARSVALVSFPGRNKQISEAFSLAADCRVVYGSEDAVQSVSHLPHRVHCETIIYGPKYSFAIFDRESVQSSEFPMLLNGLARDIVVFNQAACSSPHVIFCEKGGLEIDLIAGLLKESFEKVPAHLYHPLAEATAVAVINTRARYLLEEEKNILCSSDLKWTICINNELSLEEPVQGRCIFLKEVDDISQILHLITRKVQTVALSIGDTIRRQEYTRELGYRGVDRVMIPGTMHEYTQPWDGILGAERMVRWVAVKMK